MVEKGESTLVQRAPLNLMFLPNSFVSLFRGMAPVLVPLRPSNEVIDVPSKLACLLFREGVLLDLPQRATFSPATHWHAETCQWVGG